MTDWNLAATNRAKDAALSFTLAPCKVERGRAESVFAIGICDGRKSTSERMAALARFRDALPELGARELGYGEYPPVLERDGEAFNYALAVSAPGAVAEAASQVFFTLLEYPSESPADLVAEDDEVWLTGSSTDV